MSDVIVGTYQQVSSVNYDEYLKAIGVSMITRKVAGNVLQVLHISVAEDIWTIKETSTFKNSEMKFELGQEFDAETADGRKAKNVITRDGNQLTRIQSVGGADLTSTYIFDETGLELMLDATNGVVAHKQFTRV
ncbi:hypothetical protein GCM10029976_091430 [Kribbella albertanoniae]|uniref:Lipocalin/fatty-acid binding family protein n=1 Tax=Kribbella albertanoniae TaxID=1266829 RepID=A0A4R4PTD8_9ACTN|nr:lipocalin/fatty-acid binding family protein [Kribbella albertanoniae]TDC25453.1 lipocalin/fatty-acid binding family protein [Kribbella albertanoniae]